jgi:hypothetical protein
VEPRNAPTVLNAVYQFRNFWDGRADAFFNGVNPLGFRDPDARVKVYVNGTMGAERLDIPFSSLASQAVGPLESTFEMVYDTRPHRDLGKKLSAAIPLAGQNIACDDFLLGTLTGCAPPVGNAPQTYTRGLTSLTYGPWIKSIFQERFWGDGSGGDVCLDAAGNAVLCSDPAKAYTLLEWNFSLFFGLAVQAYEATLYTEQTIVDLAMGGIAVGTLTNGTGKNQKVVNVAGLPLEACIAQLALNNNAAQQLAATNLCANHYANFIHPEATAGAEANLAPNPVPPNARIGGCPNPLTCNASPNEANGRATLLNVERGVNRFFAGATACGICHFNPEFTGATVSAITGFGAAPNPVLPPGQIAREIELPVVMERMVTFNALPAVYDAGFYNLGVRPTYEDLSLGGAIGGVPLSLAKIAEVIAGGNAAGLDTAKIETIRQRLAAGQLVVPTSAVNLSPRPFQLDLACGPGLNNPNANNNPRAGCVPNLIPGERILRNGAFKAQGLRNVKFTGPYLHNGSKMNLRQVMEFYKTAGHFTGLNFNNLDAGMRIFQLTPADEAAVVEMMETGLTDWRLAYQQGRFDHPEICIPNGHDPVTGNTRLVGVPAVGRRGNGAIQKGRLQTFEEHIDGTLVAGGTQLAQTLTDACTVPGIVDGTGSSTIEVPPPPAP